MTVLRRVAARAPADAGDTPVAEAMHTGVVTCPPHVSVAVAARIMAAHGIHAVVVVEPGSAQTPPLLWGVVTDVQVVEALADGCVDGRTALEAAAQPPLVVTPAAPLGKAVRLMREHRATHLVVVDPVARRPVGMLSTLDVAEVLARDA